VPTGEKAQQNKNPLNRGRDDSLEEDLGKEAMDDAVVVN